MRHDPAAPPVPARRHRRDLRLLRGEDAAIPLVVIPTAGGKSLVMAAFIQEVLAHWPDQRILILTHVRELISQNFAELIRLWPEAPAGHLQRRAEPPRRPGADPVRRHPVDPPPRLRRPACRPGADRRGAPDPAQRRTPCTAASSTTLTRHQPAAQGHRPHRHALPPRQRHAARGHGRAVHRHRLRGLGPRADRRGLPLRR